MRLLPVLPAALIWALAVCSALITGLVMAGVRLALKARVKFDGDKSTRTRT
jgi:hypothetical protein